MAEDGSSAHAGTAGVGTTHGPGRQRRHLLPVIPDCRRHVVPGADRLFLLDQPEDVAGVIERFLAEGDGGASARRPRSPRATALSDGQRQAFLRREPTHGSRGFPKGRSRFVRKTNVSRPWDAVAVQAPYDDVLSEFAIRPIRPDDRERILHAIDYTSAQTYSRRFHEVGHHFTDRELTNLTDLDGENHVALIATERSRPDRLVAIARFVRDPSEPNEAEFAVTVHDPYQRRGIGCGMLNLLEHAALERGVRRFRAFIETDNDAMIALMRKVFPDAKQVSRYGRTGEYVVELADRREIGQCGATAPGTRR